MQDQADDALLARIAQGEQPAMRALYERYQTPLYRYIRTRLPDPHEAADALHDVMLDVWRKAGPYSGQPVKPWLYTIARNKAIDRLRKTQRDVPTEPDETIADDAPTPEELTAATQDASRVRRCLEGLKAAHRTVLQLAFYQQLSYAEIAEVEKVPLGTIKTRVHHAKQLMARCLTAL